MRRELSPLVDELSVDAAGNLVGLVRGGGKPKITGPFTPADGQRCFRIVAYDNVGTFFAISNDRCVTAGDVPPGTPLDERCVVEVEVAHEFAGAGPGRMLVADRLEAAGQTLHPDRALPFAPEHRRVLVRHGKAVADSADGTDHSREHVPMLAYGEKVKPGVNIGTRSTYADLAATVAEYLGVKAEIAGESFLSEILK